jgi:hypothetical protein
VQFSEFEMTTMLHGVAKTQTALRARVAQTAGDQAAMMDAISAPVTDEDRATAWETVTKMDRYHLISAFSERILPVLPLLPDQSVEPGQRATYEPEQVIAAARESVQHDVAMDKVALDAAEDLIRERAHFAVDALRFLPLKPVESAEDDFPVVPDTPEGLI